MIALQTFQRGSIALITLGFAALALPVLAGPPADWPQFHGPNRNNMSTETGLLKRWPDGGPKLLWTARGIGPGFATVSIAGGTIYTAGSRDGKTAIAALDLAGKTLWQVHNGKAWEQKGLSGSRGTPTIDDGRLYHESPHGDVVCLDAKTGEKIWGLNILDTFHAKNITWALAESLLIDGEHVICCPGGPETSVVALDKRTGRVVWKCRSTGDQAGYASPVLAEYQGLRMILVMTSQGFIGVNADTGNSLWRIKRIVPWEEMIFAPVYHDGHVFISTPHRTGCVKWKIRVEGDKASLTEVWKTTDLDVQFGGAILYDGYVYGAAHRSSNAKWVCLDWNTGRTMYVDGGVGRGSVTFAQGLLYTLSERHVMGLVRADPSGHKLLGRFPLPEGGEGPSWAHPVVCGGRLYIRHGNLLFAYDIRAK